MREFMGLNPRVPYLINSNRPQSQRGMSGQIGGISRPHASRAALIGRLEDRVPFRPLHTSNNVQ